MNRYPFRSCKYRRVIEGAGEHHDAGNAENEAEVTDAIDQERLQIGKNRRLALEPETDQQVGHQADRFPAEKQLQEVVRHDQHQHRKREQRDIAEETLVTRIVVHVADRVDVHHQRHEGHDAHHQRRQAIDEEADLHAQPVGHGPGVDADVLDIRATPEHVPQNEQRQQERHTNGDDRHPVRPCPADLVAGQPGNDCRCKRCQDDCQVVAVHISPSACSAPARQWSADCGTAPRGSQGR